MLSKLAKYCTPAQVYLFFAVISLILGFLVNFKFVTLLVNTFFVLVWAWILDWLCRKGVGILSWILVLLPFVYFTAAFWLAVEARDKAKGDNKERMDVLHRPLGTDASHVGGNARLPLVRFTAFTG